MEVRKIRLSEDLDQVREGKRLDCFITEDKKLIVIFKKTRPKGSNVQERCK